MTTPFRNISVLLTANNTQLRTSLAQSAASVNAFDSAVQKSNKTMSTGSKVGLGVLAGGALAAGAGLLYATGKAIAFDKAMRNVNSISGLTEKEFAALEAQVISMSTVLPQSATELAEGLYDIASSGFQGADGLKVLDAAARSASAGMSTTAVAAKGITAVLNSYGLGAESAADVSDVLFQTVNAGVITFEELAGSIGDVTGIAATAGVAVEELGAAYATMTLQGVGGTESATLLTNIFSKMLKPSEALTTMMKDLGYESGEAMLKANGLKGSMDLLREATGGSATAIFEIFPDIQAARGALALMANDGAIAAESWDKIADAENRAGATQKTLNEQMKSLSSQMTLAKNQVDAMATSLGIRLLPGLLSVLEGSREVGGELRDGLGAIIEALGPTWENLGEILGDVWEVLVELGQAVGPLAGAFATLAIGGVVVTLNALSEVLSIVTGFMAENEAVALTLAIALGIMLAGGVGALATKIQVALVLALDSMLTALGTASAGLAGFSAALAASLAAAGGIAALLAGAFFAWQGYTEGANQAKDALKAFNAASSIDNPLEKQVQGVHDLTKSVDDMEARLVELDNRGTLSKIFNVKAAAEELGLRRNIQEVADAAGLAEQDLFRLQGAVVAYMAAQSGLTGAEVAEKFGTAEAATRTFTDSLPLLSKAGVDVGDSMMEVKAKIDSYKRSQEVGQGATESVVEALGDLGNEAKDTETAIDDLKKAFDRLVGVFISSDEATIAFEAAIDGLAAVTKDSTRSLDANSEAGRKNRQAINESVTSLLDQVEAGARAGESSDKLGEKLNKGRDRIIAAAKAAGFNTGEINKMLEQYNLTPELVQTIVEAVGVQPTKEQVQALQDKFGNLDRTVAKPRIAIQGMAAFEQNIITAEKAFARLSRVQVTGTATGDGPGRLVGGPVLNRVSGLMEGIEGLRVTSTYRTPAANRAAGGSPTSYHTDKGNPAVDVGGSTSALDRLASRARARGGWRELLWRVPGHYDHVHFAAQGGPIAGPGTGTSDSIPAWLSHGEHVWTAKEVARAGGHGAVEAIRSQYRYADGGAVVVQKFATGGAVSATDPRSLTTATKGLTDITQINALVAAWERYNDQLEQAARRRELVSDAQQAARELKMAKSTEDRAAAQRTLNQANQAVRDFDFAAARKRETEAIDAQIEAIEREIQAREEALENQRRGDQIMEEARERKRGKQDNMFDVGAISAADYLVIIEARLAGEQRYSDEWTALWQQRQQLLDQQKQAEQQVTDDLKQQVDDRLQAQESALGKLNSLLDQEAEVRASMLDNEQRLAERMQEIEQRRIENEAAYQERSAANAVQFGKTREKQEKQVSKSLQAATDRYADERLRAQQQADQRSLDAYRSYTSQQDAILAEQRKVLEQRRDELVGWASLTEVAERGWGNSAGQLISNARDQAEQFSDWVAALAEARTKGLSEQVIKALGLDEGPAALAQLASLNAATEQEVASLNEAVLARTEQANAQVVAEQERGLGDVSGAMAEAHRTYTEATATIATEQAAALSAALAAYTESTAEIQAAHAEQALEAQQEYADAQAELLSRLGEAQAELQGAVTEAQDAFRLRQAELVVELASIGQDQGRSYADAMAAGIASGIPGIVAAAQAATAATRSLAEAQAALAAQQAQVATSPAAGPAPTASSSARAGYFTFYDSARQQDRQLRDTPANRAYAAARGTIRQNTYDSGGWLQPGFTLAYNGTGQRERVMTSQQYVAATSGSAGGGGIVINVNAPVFGVDHLQRTIVGAVESTLGARRTASAIAGQR